MLIAIWPLVVAFIGALVYALAANGKASEMGRLMFFGGLFWLVYGLASKTLHLG